MKRRQLLKSLSLLPLAGGITNLSLQAEPAPAEDLYKELGIRTFINAAGTLTYMTGSIMQEKVLKAINSSVGKFCMLDELQDKVGEQIAKMTHAEAATVTSGAYSAMTLGLAGVLTGLDMKKVGQLPNLDGMKSEVICQRAHKDAYTQAFLLTGCKIITVETREELEKAINEKTAMMHFLNIAVNGGKIKHEEWIEVGKKHNIPTSIDIAADVPPVENLWKFNDMGFDLVFLSGGKAVRAPQSTGYLMGRLKAAAMDAAPSLRVVVSHGVGTDAIAVKYATMLGIPVANVPSANAQAVAEHTIALMMAAAKHVVAADAATRRVDFDFKYRSPLTELSGKVLGVVGFGDIGRRVAAMAKAAFGMDIQIHSASATDQEITSLGYRRALSLEGLLEQSDIVTLHNVAKTGAPPLIGARELAKMKSHSILVNTARGALVDEMALADALSAGRITSAALDVFQNESMPATHPLLRLPNVVLSPHVAGSSAEALRRTAVGAADRVIAILSGTALNVVNPECWDRRRTAPGVST